MRLTPFGTDKPLSFAARYAATRNAHLMFLGSTIIYVIVVLLAKSMLMNEGSGFAGFPDSTYTLLVAALAVASVVLGYLVLVFLPRRTAAQDAQANPVVCSIELGQQLSTRHFERVQLCQFIGVCGLVLSLYYGALLPVLLFGGINLALLLAIYPRRAQWDEARRQAEQEGIVKTAE